jgi:uncharacterized integral membrane protein
MKKSKTFLLLAILAAIVAVLAAFAWENWEPQISLAFWGMRSQYFPLAIWVILALLAGILTSVIISSLFTLSNYLTWREATHHSPEKINAQVPLGGTTSVGSETNAPPEGDRSSESGQPSEKRGFFNLKKGSPGPQPSGNGDDWDDGPSKQEDWGSEGHTAASGPSTFGGPEKSATTTPKTYEVKQDPKSESWSGSVYSYGYKEPSGSGVGQSESVYDADYRIITPPPPPESTSKPDASPREPEKEQDLSDRPEEGP